MNSTPVMSEEGYDDFLKSLDTVWKQQEAQTKQSVNRLSQKIVRLNEDISNRVIAAIEPSNARIKDEIMAVIESNKKEIAYTEDELSTLKEGMDGNKDHFLRFAFAFIDNLGSKFLELSHEDRLMCKEVIFPAGFYINAHGIVYTPQISPLISLQPKKKDTEVSQDSLLVLLKRMLYNLSDPCKKLIRIVDSTEFGELLRQDYNPSEIPGPVRRARRLSATNISELVGDYEAGGGSIYTLATKYGVHRNTIASLLKSQGVSVGKTAMNKDEIAWARQLLSEGLSWNAIGSKIGRDPKTVKKFLA